MGHSIVTVAALLALASLLVAQKIASYISEVRFKKAHGCKPMARMPQWERILGYSFFQEQKRLAKNKGLVEASCKRYKEVGNTYSFSILGRVVINTIEPENIKTLLATNFNDFGLGHRIRSFGPLLGQGIFTSDGAQWEHSRVIEHLSRGPAMTLTFSCRPWSDQTLPGPKLPTLPPLRHISSI